MSFKKFKELRLIENIFDRYQIGKLIGEGQFGQVRLAWHKLANINVAIKIIKKEHIDKNEMSKQLMVGELNILEETCHPNIMRIYELLHDQKRYYIVSEYIEHGQLFDFLQKRKDPLSELEVVNVAK